VLAAQANLFEGNFKKLPLCAGQCCVGMVQLAERRRVFALAFTTIQACNYQ
jgi:hypothetical protein